LRDLNYLKFDKRNLILKNIIIQAPAYSLSGYGAHSRDIIEALWGANSFNVCLKPTNWGSTSSSNLLTPHIKDILDFCSHNKFHNDIDYIFIHVGIPPEFKKESKTFNIGITAGLEADYISQEWVNFCNDVDMVIVPSQFEKSIFINSGVKTKVEVVNEGVDTTVFNPMTPPIKLDTITTKFNFLCVGQWLDYNIGVDRKQIGVLLNTFYNTFKENKDVGLILKTFTYNNSTPDSYFLQERIKELKDKNESNAKVYLLHGEMTENEMASLYNFADVFVLFTSGEGFGRPLAEAVSCDLPVITTGWSGHTEFLSHKNSTLLPYKLGLIPNIPFFEKGMKWAYVDVEKAIEKMLHCVQNYEIYLNKAIEAGKEFRAQFNKKVAYDKLINILKEV
jgi:glycosyltransferase involved in cell wall biosynthesis